MEKTFPKDIPSVNKVMLQLKNDVNIHQSYLKKIIQKEIEIIRKMLKMVILINQQKNLLQILNKKS